MQKNEDSGVSEFKRVKPKPVPENWREEAKLLIKQTRDYMESDEFERLEDPRKPIYDKDYCAYTWGPPVERVLPKASDVLAYFETLIVTKSVSAALLRIWERSEKIEASDFTLDLPVLYDDGDLVNEFILWWLHIHTNYPNFTLKEMVEPIKLAAEQAAVDCLRGGDVNESYALMWKEMKVVEGRVDLEGEDGR